MTLLKAMGRMGKCFASWAHEMRCVVIRGAGERAFGPGNDISEFKTDRSNARQAKQYGDLMHGTIQALKSMPHPTVAMIHGIVLVVDGDRRSLQHPYLWQIECLVRQSPSWA